MRTPTVVRDGKDSRPLLRHLATHLQFGQAMKAGIHRSRPKDSRNTCARASATLSSQHLLRTTFRSMRPISSWTTCLVAQHRHPVVDELRHDDAAVLARGARGAIVAKDLHGHVFGVDVQL